MNEDIEKSVDVLKKGGIILYPTDTIWGIGCDATNTEAVDRIYRLKKRSDSKSMLVLIENTELLHHYVNEIPAIAWQLLDAAVNPLTLIYPGAKNLATNLISENGSVGIRIPNDKFCLNLLRRFKKPLVSTSANESGQEPPACFNEISKEIKDGTDYIVRWKQNILKPAVASSIIELGLRGEIRILRK